jgi:hypothetical protein
MLGIPGLSILLLLIFMPLRYPLPKPFKLFSVIFIVTSALFMFIEAALQTQAGIVFFTFFSTLMAKVLYSASND